MFSNFDGTAESNEVWKKVCGTHPKARNDTLALIIVVSSAPIWPSLIFLPFPKMLGQALSLVLQRIDRSLAAMAQTLTTFSRFRWINSAPVAAVDEGPTSSDPQYSCVQNVDTSNKQQRQNIVAAVPGRLVSIQANHARLEFPASHLDHVDNVSTVSKVEGRLRSSLYLVSVAEDDHV